MRLSRHVPTSHLFVLPEIIDNFHAGDYAPRTMETLILPLLLLTFALDRHLAIENLALRQQLAILRRQAKRPKLRTRDRVFWVIVSNLWKDWRSALIVVTPDTVIRWHRRGLKTSPQQAARNVFTVSVQALLEAEVKRKTWATTS